MPRKSMQESLMIPISHTKHDIGFDFETMRWSGITIEQLKIWEKLYPDVNIAQVLRQDMIEWLEKKVISRKPLKVGSIARKKDWKRTIMNWLKKEQMKAALQ